MYGWSQNECAAGDFFKPHGSKINIFANVYVLLVKSECTAGSKQMCGWGFLSIPGG